MTKTRAAARPPVASTGAPVVLEIEPSDAALGALLGATAARIGVDLRVHSGATRVAIDATETLAHAIRSEVLARVDGSIDLEPGVSARARRVLEGLVGAATSRSAAIVREESDGRLTLHLRDRLPVDLGEPPEAAAALRNARTRQMTARLSSEGAEVKLPPGAEERARAITFGPSRTLSDPSSRRVLEAFGIPAAAWRLAENAARAAAHARVVGYPVDLRIASPDVSAIDDPHFAAIELRSPGEVREGFRTIAREVRRLAPNARTLGVTVSRHVAGAPTLRLALERGTPDRLRIALDDAIGKRLARPLTVTAPGDAAATAAALSCFEGRDVLPSLDSMSGRALVELIARFARLALVLADTLTSAEIAPLAPLGEGWVVLGTRLSVRGVDLPTGS